MAKSLFARIAVNLPAVTGVFDYHVPDGMMIEAGSLVTAPFGKQIIQGVVMELIETPSVAETKDLIDKLDPLPVITQAQISLARGLADSTLNPIAAIIGMMIPTGLNQHADVQYSIVSDQLSVKSDQWTIVQKRLIDILVKRGSIRGRQIDRHFANTDWRRSAQVLIRRGVIQSQSVLPPPSVRPKFIRTAQLAVTPDQAEAAMDSLGTEKTLSRRQAALRFLIHEPDAINASWVYAESGCNLADLEALAEQELIVLRETEIFRDPLRSVDQKNIEKKEIQLTQDQQSALNEILSSLIPNSQSPIPNPFLLHGVTGSGKTEIYLRAAEATIKCGKGVLILVPEIALTPQTVHRFLARFPGQVGLIHSKLSEGERYDTWRRIRSGQIKVVIGARSALFAPLPSIGLIVLDECHDPSYYQSEPPFYHALSAAQTYARLCGAVCVMGSATPPVSIKHRNDVNLLELPHRVTHSELPPVSIVDMREELKDGNRSIFSRALSESLAETIERGEQAILFLNRRGTATYVFCRNCGTSITCPKCDTTLTLHVRGTTGQQDNGTTLLCHRCGYTRQMPKKCVHCNSDQIRAFGLGSEKVEADVKSLLPQARVLRWDWDTTRRKDAHEIILTHFANHNADILVGTQMLAKGLDLPLVTLVGIVLADVGINLPDPFATERSFQTLTQVAGRAGRSSRGGKVIMQTFQPENAVIQFASKHDYVGFYRSEIDQRQRLGYPPFTRLARLEYRHRDPLEAERITSGIAKLLRERVIKENRVQTEIIGAVPCYFAKVNDVHRWQIVVRAPDPVEVIRGIRLDGWRIEIDPVSLL